MRGAFISSLFIILCVAGCCPVDSGDLQCSFVECELDDSLPEFFNPERKRCLDGEEEVFGICIPSYSVRPGGCVDPAEPSDAASEESATELAIYLPCPPIEPEPEYPCEPEPECPFEYHAKDLV
jgi:hypothetical protein